MPRQWGIREPNSEKKTCPACNREFWTARPNRKFCEYPVCVRARHNQPYEVGKGSGRLFTQPAASTFSLDREIANRSVFALDDPFEREEPIVVDDLVERARREPVFVASATRSRELKPGSDVLAALELGLSRVDRDTVDKYRYYHRLKDYASGRKIAEPEPHPLRIVWGP